MEKFKNGCHKVAHALEWAIGYALLICLFVGGLGFIGYVIALCIGGETATSICTWLYKKFYVVLIKISTITTVVCFIMLYLRGDANWHNPIKYWKNVALEKRLKKEATSKPIEEESAIEETESEPSEDEAQN